MKNDKKDVIFMTALKANDPNMFDYMEWSLKTWKWWAKKHNVELFILDEPLCDTELMRPTWQRWYVYDILEANDINYNRVALIDIDTMVHWLCPNIFELSNGNYTAVRDDLSIEWTYNSLMGYKKFFSGVDLEWTDYVNNGMLVLPKDNGKEFCDKLKESNEKNGEELRDMQHNTLKKGTDQTPVNYLAKQFFGNDITYLSKKFNMTHMYKTHAFVDGIFTKCSYIWHFNGLPREERNGLMKQTWDFIRQYYV